MSNNMLRKKRKKVEIDFFALLALISTGGGLHRKPIEPQNVAAGAM
jgi:hypothetical protein